MFAFGWWSDFLICSILVSFLAYKYLTRNFHYWKKRGIPYLQPQLFFGNVREIITIKKATSLHFQDLYNKLSEPYFGMFVLDKPALMVRSPELVKHILVKDFNYFDDRTVFSGKKVDTQQAQMLFFSINPVWKTNRTKLSPVFSSGKLRGMVPLICEIGRTFADNIRKLQGKTVEVKELSSRYAVDVVTSCFFGINAHSFDKEDADFRIVAGKFFDFRWSTAIQQAFHFFSHGLVKFFKMHFFDQNAVRFLENAFMETLRNRQAENYSRNDMVDLLIRMKNDGNTDVVEYSAMKAHATQFFVAGTETTSATTSFALYELAIHPEIQDKVRREIQICIKKHNGINYESMKEMIYLDQCVCETLRKYPVLAFLDRVCTQNYLIPGTKDVIEKGSNVYIPMFGLHYDPKYWPNPEKFDPERFAANNRENITPYTYIPFGTGPRNCIGERFGIVNVKFALIYVLNEFTVFSCEDTEVPLTFSPKGIILQPPKGVQLVFKKTVDNAH